MIIEFRLPWPPTVNTYYVCIHGRKVVSKKGRTYTNKVKQLIERAKLDFCIESEIEMELQYAPPKNGTWDGDNYTKALFDALTKSGFWRDDSLVTKYSVEKLPKYAMGEVYVKVWER